MAEQEPGQVWRIWVDTKRRIVSFHPVEGFEALEFRPGPGHVFPLRGRIHPPLLPLPVSSRFFPENFSLFLWTNPPVWRILCLTYIISIYVFHK